MTSLSDLLDFQVDIAYTHPEFSRIPEDRGAFEKAYILGRAFEWREQFRKDHHWIWRLGDNLRSFKKSLVKS